MSRFLLLWKKEIQTLRAIYRKLIILTYKTLNKINIPLVNLKRTVYQHIKLIFATAMLFPIYDIHMLFFSHGIYSDVFRFANSHKYIGWYSVNHVYSMDDNKWPSSWVISVSRYSQRLTSTLNSEEETPRRDNTNRITEILVLRTAISN